MPIISDNEFEEFEALKAQRAARMQETAQKQAQQEAQRKEQEEKEKQLSLTAQKYAPAMAIHQARLDDLIKKQTA